MEIYSRFHGPEKKFQQHDDYGMYVIFRGGGDASQYGRHLGFVEIRKGMMCRGTKIFFFNCKSVELWYIPVFFWKNDVIWCYITLNYRYVRFMLINSI